MKTLKIIFTVCLSMMLFISQAAAQQDTTIKIKTSGQCEKCKARIESGLSFEKGVKAVVFDVKTEVVTVKYNPKKTSPEKIKTAITKIGYDADEMAADENAYDKLPKCCKKNADK
jgi:copper chaperone CopZ